MVGIVGAVIGGFLFGSSTVNQNVFQSTSLLVSFIGAIVLLAIIKLVRHGLIVWRALVSVFPRHCQGKYGYAMRSLPATGSAATLLHWS